MPIDRGVIDAQLREIGEGDRWWEQREFRELPHILKDGERLRGLIVGKLLGPRRPRIRPAPRWLMVVTDQRLLCLRRERIARRQVEIVPAEFMRLSIGSRFGRCRIGIETPTWSYRLRVPQADAFRFITALQSLVPAPVLAHLEPGAENTLPGGLIASLPVVGRLAARGGPVPDPVSREQMERVEVAVERLQGEVERLQQQVAFLEDLLQRRAETESGRALARSAH